MNTVQLIGRLTRDPEAKDVNGKQVTSFSIAVNAGKDKAFFFDCEAWEKTAEFVAKHFTKGKLIAVEGRLIQERWEKDGQKHSRVKIGVGKVHFCGDSAAAKVEETFVNPFNDAEVPF